MRPNPPAIPPEVVYASHYATLALALAAAAGKRLILEGKSYTGLANLTPASGTSIEGAGDGKTVLLAPASPTAPIFDLNGVSDISLAGFGMEPVSGTASSNGIGIRARGRCENLYVEDVTAEGFVNGVRLAGNEGTVATANSVQVITIGGTPTGGTWTAGLYPPTGGDYQVTGNLARTISAADLVTALEGLAFIGSGNVAVTGSFPEWTITAQGSLAGRYVPLMHVVGSLTGGTNATISIIETTKGGSAWIQHTTLRRVRAKDSPTEFGFRFDDVDDLIMDGCRADGNWLDGVKGRRFCHNLQILGGNYSRNGRGLTSASDPNGGDGIDLYAGGEFTRIVGATFEENRANGIQIKNDDGGSGSFNLSGYGSGGYGFTRKLEIIGVNASRNTFGSGILIDEAGDTAANSYSVSHTTIMGGLFEDNLTDGVFVKSGRDLGLIGVKAVRNGIRGIEIGPNVTGVDIDGCMGIANGRSASSGIGLYIAGDEVVVRGGRYLGTWDDAIRDADDRTALTNYHSADIFVVAGATGIIVDPSVRFDTVSTTATNLFFQPTARYLQGWAADDAQNPSLGTMPSRVWVKAVHVHVTEAFNSDGTDEITIGYDADPDAFATAVDVSTTGIKAVTLGVLAGYNATSRAVEAYYTNGGSEPTTGKALVVLEYAHVAPQIA